MFLIKYRLHLYSYSCWIFVAVLVASLQVPVDGFLTTNHGTQRGVSVAKATSVPTQQEDEYTLYQQEDEYTLNQGVQRKRKEGLPEIFIPHSLPDNDEDERLWVPQTESVSFRPLCLCVSGGYYVNLLRVKGSGLLSRHRHPGPVHGHVIKGRWRYLEHDWIAQEGSYIFEPPGEVHTLVVPEGVEEMITLFHVTGSLLYCDPDGKVVGADDVFTKLELAKKHYEKVGLGADFVQQFVR